ncbi:MAG: hypothetical protein UV59_C0026G0014 [Candidatus Gottesmanbacteria bacterium GW2011_GWA1_43_11]|uniref:Uncharacterized protein n=1 Tax=Candidatus Gottesmanbacteria bacterium GW2011_GWA1_43_11 TaxID=1618436 RepID=A0A0G1CFB5_9BACT|nr:MAG: hypothetical protein UV59_C0026G0014 [Candidatus Gottesmanbacteria bacterium GW2011_GWA1_43_11]
MTRAPTGMAGCIDPDCTISSLYKFCAGMSAPVKNSATAIVSKVKISCIDLHKVFTFLGQTNIKCKKNLGHLSLRGSRLPLKYKCLSGDEAISYGIAAPFGLAMTGIDSLQARFKSALQTALHSRSNREWRNRN